MGERAALTAAQGASAGTNGLLHPETQRVRPWLVILNAKGETLASTGANTPVRGLEDEMNRAAPAFEMTEPEPALPTPATGPHNSAREDLWTDWWSAVRPVCT